MTDTRNPFVVALAILTGLFAVIAVIAYVIGVGQSNSIYERESAIVTYGVAGSWLTFTIIGLLATLVAAAVTWRAPAPALVPEATIVESSND